MSALLFLGIALVLSLAGFLVLWMRNRPPRTVDAHIRAFARELEALAPEPPVTQRPTTAPPMAPRSAAPRSTSSRPTAPPAGQTQQPKAPPRRGRHPG